MKENGTVLGIDVGVNSALTLSDNRPLPQDIHGHSYKTITERLARKRKGSKSFHRSVSHRTNHINWLVRNIDLDAVFQINVEDLKQMRKGKNFGRHLSHFNYAELFERLEAKAASSGVRMKRVLPSYTSQRCSACGWTQKENRDGIEFRCCKCGRTCNADLNAAINISLDLPSRKNWSHRSNRSHWNDESKELVVPYVRETHNFHDYD